MLSWAIKSFQNLFKKSLQRKGWVPIVRALAEQAVFFFGIKRKLSEVCKNRMKIKVYKQKK
jgi:hypothetical protein